MPFSLKTGKSLTYGIGKSLTWGIGETLTCFEVLTGTKNRKINEGNCKELNQHGVSPPENKRDAKPKPCASLFISRNGYFTSTFFTEPSENFTMLKPFWSVLTCAPAVV